MKTRKAKPQRGPLEKAGTTAHWQRPWCGTYEIADDGSEVDLLDVLVRSGMAQSNAEARRLVMQGAVWSMDEEPPRRLVDRMLRPFAGERLAVGKPRFVDMGDKRLMDLTKAVIVLFVRKEGKRDKQG